MKTPFRPATALLLAAVLATATIEPASAGQSCEVRPATIGSLRRGLALAESTAQALDQTGADVIAIGRAGQDLRRYRLDWSHLGYAYRIMPPGIDGSGRPVTGTQPRCCR